MEALFRVQSGFSPTLFRDNPHNPIRSISVSYLHVVAEMEGPNSLPWVT